jgi:transcriptional regulator with XRE-family HTH domain
MSDHTFAERLRHHREAACLTTAALAIRAGVSRQYVYELEAGRKNPTWEMVCRLADALEIGVEKFR